MAIGGRTPIWFIILVGLLMLWIILSISRRRSNLARWAFTGLLMIYIFWFAYQSISYRAETRAIDFAFLPIVEWLLGFAAVIQLWLLWSGETKRWLDNGDAASVR